MPIESQTPGFDPTKPTPAHPSTREGWDPSRHEGALEFHRQQNARPGMEDPARRNQYCPKCRGVVAWTAERCPHCSAEIPRELRDYYNFSDFEPRLDKKEVGPIVIAALVAVLAIGGVVALAVLATRWIAGS